MTRHLQSTTLLKLGIASRCSVSFLFSVRVVDGQGTWQLLKIMDNMHCCDVHGDFVVVVFSVICTVC